MKSAEQLTTFGQPVATVADVNAAVEIALAAKRCFDVIVASGVLICCLPILATAMALISLESWGSPIFLQDRVGRGNRVFSIIKLRTMYAGAEKLGFKTTYNDGRLTRTGKILRLLNIDELPQLINILRGDMSVIGPRPLSLDETQHITSSLNISSTYPGLCPGFRPGLVGLEQVNRTRQLSYLERFELNHRYERTWTPMLDLQIFAKAMVMCKWACVATIVGGLIVLVMAAVTRFTGI